MKKYLLTLLISGMLLLPANAGMINSEYDAKAKLTKINQLIDKNFADFVNKSDMIGEKAINFQMATIQYKQTTKVSAEAIKSQINEIQIIKNSADYSDSDKDSMIKKLYIDIETNVYNIDSQSLNYLISLRRVMPSITYQKYVKNFKEYYNSLGLTGNALQYDAVEKLR